MVQIRFHPAQDGTFILEKQIARLDELGPLKKLAHRSGVSADRRISSDN
jgi:hypothetical protein